VPRTEDGVVEPVFYGIDLTLHERLLHQVVLLDELHEVHRDYLDALLFEIAEALRKAGYDHVLVKAHANLDGLGGEGGKPHARE
jgi:hypothetical protein